MADYYQNALLTISAALATEGMFKEQPRTANIHYHVEPPEKYDQAPYTVCIRIPLSHESSTLHTRSWVFQEHLLSPKVVHFGDEVLWECAERTVCEYGRFPLPTDGGKEPHPDVGDIGNVLTVYGRKQGHLNSLFHKPLTSDDAAELNQRPPGVQGIDERTASPIQCRWLDIVAQYTRRKLTFGSDIFPVLAGLVKQSQPLRKCSYYAGLWADSLAMDLLWRSRSPETHPRLSTWRAPSWSWASTTAPVDYYHIMIDFRLATHMFTYGICETFVGDVVVECIPDDQDDEAMRLR
jgi:hypothetical protein